MNVAIGYVENQIREEAESRKKRQGILLNSGPKLFTASSYLFSLMISSCLCVDIVMVFIQ